MIDGTNGAERMSRGPTGQELVYETLTTVVFLAMLVTVAATLTTVESTPQSVMIGRYESP